MAERILLVEYEKELACMVKLKLQYEGYEMEKAFDGHAGLDWALLGEFDPVLLDIILPALPGMEVPCHLRRESAIPVIMFTTRSTVVDKVSGPDTGADDCTTKPFTIEELLARIRTALRKRPAQAAGPSRGLLTAGPLIMDTDRHEVSVNGGGAEFTRRELDLLRYLLENKGRIISRKSLLDHMWGFGFVGETNAVDVYIRFPRAKINRHFGIGLIHIVHGMGYVIREEER